MESLVIASLLNVGTLTEVIALLNAIVQLWKIYKDICEEFEEEQEEVQISGLRFTKGEDF